MSEIRNKLIKRLEAVSQNNCAYIEVYGTERHYREIYKEIKSLKTVKALEPKVLALEQSILNIEAAETLRKVEIEIKKKSAEKKLNNLGITKEELLALLKE